jgi:hypothetical protein
MECHKRIYRLTNGSEEARNLVETLRKHFKSSWEYAPFKPGTVFVRQETEDYQYPFKYKILRTSETSQIYHIPIGNIEGTLWYGLLEIPESERDVIDFLDKYEYRSELKGGKGKNG